MAEKHSLRLVLAIARQAVSAKNTADRDAWLIRLRREIARHDEAMRPKPCPPQPDDRCARCGVRRDEHDLLSLSKHGLFDHAFEDYLP